MLENHASTILGNKSPSIKTIIKNKDFFWSFGSKTLKTNSNLMAANKGPELPSSAIGYETMRSNHFLLYYFLLVIIGDNGHSANYTERMHKCLPNYFKTTTWLE